MVAEQVEEEDPTRLHREGIVQRLPILMMSDYEEDLDDFPILSTENTSEKAESLVHIARNQQINGQLQVELLRKCHNSLRG